MFKPILKVATLGAALIATPVLAASDPAAATPAHVKKVKSAPPKKPASDKSGMLPAAVLLSGVVLVTLANRRRNLQKVLN